MKQGLPHDGVEVQSSAEDYSKESNFDDYRLMI